LGLGAAIERHARRIEQRGDVRVDVVAPPAGRLLGADTELALYRIVQEAMTNAARHAHARTIRVRSWREDGELVTVIEDDGRGFDVEASVNNRDRLGLFGMEERAAYFGGRLEIISDVGAGTTVRVTLPLSAHVND
ncbi:MAG: sensor histidine kinase, partial [Longimicrobiales bacterium]